MRLIRGAKNGVLTEREGKRLLALYGIPVTREVLATGADEAACIVQDLTFPVVMKVELVEILHKKDVGGVVLNISSPEAAVAAFEQIVASVRLCRPEPPIAGVVVQEMAKSGTEVMLGATFDPQFGPVVALSRRDLGRGAKGLAGFDAAFRCRRCTGSNLRTAGRKRSSRCPRRGEGGSGRPGRLHRQVRYTVRRLGQRNRRDRYQPDHPRSRREGPNSSRLPGYSEEIADCLMALLKRIVGFVQ